MSPWLGPTCRSSPPASADFGTPPDGDRTSLCLAAGRRAQSNVKALDEAVIDQIEVAGNCAPKVASQESRVATTWLGFGVRLEKANARNIYARLCSPRGNFGAEMSRRRTGSISISGRAILMQLMHDSSTNPGRRRAWKAHRDRTGSD